MESSQTLNNDKSSSEQSSIKLDDIQAQLAAMLPEQRNQLFASLQAQLKLNPHNGMCAICE